jgi:hypothetical protein
LVAERRAAAITPSSTQLDPMDDAAARWQEALICLLPGLARSPALRPPPPGAGPMTVIVIPQSKVESIKSKHLL